jgi:CheY-like chemotaxis protein
MTKLSFQEGQEGTPSREAAVQQGRLILVAEDDETCQNVTLRQFALLGYTADVASNGREALERWETGDYALLLTDLHMPKMDGYQLALAIRAKEADNTHAPIIALTANAIKGEAEHCRAIGMDEYLTKPVRLADLKTTLEKWLPLAADPLPVRPTRVFTTPSALPSATVSVPVDVSALEALVGDDPIVVHEFLRDFRISATKTASELKVAYEAGQSAQVGALAHKLKSSAHSLGALKLGELCAAIERAGKGNQIQALENLMRRFEAEMTAVSEYLESF